MTEQLISLVVPAGLTDAFVDSLLAMDFISGFTQIEISGHSRDHGNLNIAEQVTGGRRMTRFDIVHQSTDCPRLLDQLRLVDHSEEVRYWISPVENSGHL